MASLARSDGRTFLTGTWQRKIKGVEDVFQLVFKDGVAQPNGSFVVEGTYIYLPAPFTNNSTFTAHLSIVTQTVPVPTVVVAMLQSQGETYAAAYVLQTDATSPDRLQGTYIGVRVEVDDRGPYELRRLPS